MQKFYRNVFATGVLALGLAACGDDVVVTEAPPPVDNTPNIISFSVSPSSVVLAPGTFAQAGSSLVTKQGVNGTVAWTTSNAAVATVSNTGLITAVAEGAAVIEATATAGGQTAKAQIGVTVRPVQAAQVSIKSVTQFANTVPVNLGNVNGQIEVTLNFDPREQTVDSVNVFIGNKRAAKQTFATSPAAGDIVLSINTANYVKNATTGVATVDYVNGASTISAAVYPRGGAATATNTIAVVLNNTDGWAADWTKPTATANSAGGLTYWGGPTAGGVSTATLYPVIYTAGRTIQSVTWSVGGCDNATQTALPFRRTFGYAAAPASAQIDCAGYEWTGGARDNVSVSTAIDNGNNPYTTTPLIANVIVLGSTPDSLRLDYAAPEVDAPSIERAAPAVTGWINGSFNFINFDSDDDGVGLRATRDRAAFYNVENCTGATGGAIVGGLGSGINGGVACATNTIGGTPGVVNGTAPWSAYGTESDRLGNVGTSDDTPTFGTDYTNPQIRWGLDGTSVSGALTASFTTADSVFRSAKPTAGTNFWRAEFIDERSGFITAGDYEYDGATSAQVHSLSTAGHVNNAGLCVVGTAPIGASFVTAPACGLAVIDPDDFRGLRNDGWLAGVQVDIPTAEGYWGYRSRVTDRAGNNSDVLFRGTLVNVVSPFATGIGIPATMTAAGFNFTVTQADSAEVTRRSLQMQYPSLVSGLGLATDSVRYTRETVGTAFDNAITSPLALIANPGTPTPYVRHLEAVTGATWDGLADPAPSNVNGSPTDVKPISVRAWSWNHGSTLTAPAGPAPTPSSLISLPALNIVDGINFATFNTGNTTNPLRHFRIIPTYATTDQFGSTTPLRAQAVSSTNNPNAPFVRVDFYRLSGSSHFNYLGSASSPVLRDQGTNRSWVFSLPTASFVADWAGAAQNGTAPALSQCIVAVGVTAAGDGIAAAQGTGCTIP